MVKEVESVVHQMLAKDLGDAVKFNLQLLLDSINRYEDSLKSQLAARAFVDVTSALSISFNNESLLRDLNSIRSEAASACFSEIDAIIASASELPGLTEVEEMVVTKLVKKRHILVFCAAHIQCNTGNALSVKFDDVSFYKYPTEIYSQLAELYCSKVLSYPWKRFSAKSADEMMFALRCFRPKFSDAKIFPHNIRFNAQFHGSQMFRLQFDAGFLTVEHEDSDYHDFDLFVDIFQEEQRLHARRQDQAISPLDLWSKPDFIACSLRETLETTGQLDAHSLREHLYAKVKECTQFKPSLTVAVIRKLNARRVLDFSAGWGDRLTGAIAADVDKYIAFDPNTALKAGHQAIIQRYVPADRRRRFEITYVGFEDAVVRDNDVDLVFTSPPFFDFEIYTALPGQSVARYSQLCDWLVHFLLGCLRKAWGALRLHGHVVIHITDVFKTKVCEPMCLLVQSQLPGARYIGVINSLGKAERPRPLWVFRKSSEPSPGLAHAALTELQRLFPEVHDTLLRTLEARPS